MSLISLVLEVVSDVAFRLSRNYMDSWHASMVALDKVLQLKSVAAIRQHAKTSSIIDFQFQLFLACLEWPA